MSSLDGSAEGPEESVFSKLSKVTTGRWAQRYLLNPDDIDVSDVRWIWEDVFKEGTVTTRGDAERAAQLLFEEFGGHDMTGQPITKGVYLFLRRFIPEGLAGEITRTLS